MPRGSSPTSVLGEDTSSCRIVAGEDASSPRIVAGESVLRGFFSVESLVMVWEELELESRSGFWGVRGFVLLDILGVGLLVGGVVVVGDG